MQLREGRPYAIAARRLCFAVSLASAALVAACAERPLESAQLRAELPREAVPLVAVPPSGVIAQPAAPKANDVQNILAVSGGGADGAFGAGVLVGWTRKTSFSRTFSRILTKMFSLANWKTSARPGCVPR